VSLEKIRRVTHSAETSVDPQTGEALEKILIELPQDHWSGRSGERVWATPLGAGLFEIRNTPWYAYDINWGDVVRCEGMSPADLPIAAGVSRRGGHRTLRVFFLDDDDAGRDEILTEISRNGATYETRTGRCMRWISNRARRSTR
jgi:hypothetical protein